MNGTKVYCCYGMYADVGHSDDCIHAKKPDASGTDICAQEAVPLLNAGEAAYSVACVDVISIQRSFKAIADGRAIVLPATDPRLSVTVEEFEAMRRDARRHKWQPIASAPKNSDTVILCSADGNVAPGYWQEHVFGNDSWYWLEDERPRTEVFPRYWMPMPSAMEQPK